MILESSSENSSDKELEPHELKEILSKLKESVQFDIRQAAVWNTLGFILLKTGRVQVQVPYALFLMLLCSQGIYDVSFSFSIGCESCDYFSFSFTNVNFKNMQSAISVLSSLLAIAPENYDCLGNLGIAYLQM